MTSLGEHLLTNDELAARLRVDENTPPKWRIKGEGPRFLRFGRLIRYALDDVIAWEQAQLRQSTGKEGGISTCLQSISTESGEVEQIVEMQREHLAKRKAIGDAYLQGFAHGRADALAKMGKEPGETSRLD